MALTRCSMQSCGTLLSSAGKTRTSLITGFNKHESRLLSAVLCCLWDALLELFVWEQGVGELCEQEEQVGCELCPWVSDSFQAGAWPSHCQCPSSGAGAVSCASGAELCLWQLTAQLLWVQNNVFRGAGDTAACFTGFGCILWNAVPKQSTGPELEGFKSRLWEV